MCVCVCVCVCVYAHSSGYYENLDHTVTPFLSVLVSHLKYISMMRVNFMVYVIYLNKVIKKILLTFFHLL